MSEIVPVAPIGNKIQYAETLAHSNLLPKHFQNNPANLLFAIEFAEALGMKPIHAITSVHVINGKPSASADLIGTMVRRAGHKLRVTGDDTYAEATLVRADDPDFEFKARWDMDKARKAGLNTATWKAYPGAMLRSRAITEVCRAGAPDALHGIQYSTEELQSLGERPEAPTGSAADRLKAASQVIDAEPANEPVTRLDAAIVNRGGIPADVVSNTAKALADGALDDYLAWLTENNAPAHILNYVNEQRPA